jgi:ribonuclease H / adenosylcobalamin/alpha-ribazole phosphatase
MQYLYYTRHGESLINTNNVWADNPGSTNDLGLTEIGRNQAYTGANVAKATGLKPTRIICSPLARTRETAKIIAEVLGYPLEDIEYNDLFVEVQVGELEGTSFAEYVKHYTYADLGQFKGAESIKVLQQRSARALAYVQSLPDEIILIVSHSCFGRAFYRVVEGRPYTDEFLPGTIPLPYGEITQLLSPSKIA